MNYDQFMNSLQDANPPEVSKYLKALWYDKKDNWGKAHSIAQDIHDPDGSWIHGYLHRVEGDEWNAQYWYSKANLKMPGNSLEEEWETLVGHLLNKYDRK
jgi:hypothetical protein